MIPLNIFSEESITSKLRTIAFLFITAYCLINCIPHEVMAHGWKAPKEESAKQNPVEKSEHSINSGQKLYTQFCADCHGKNAGGSISYRGNSKTKPPDLEQRAKHHSDGDFFWKIRHGRGEMPSFKDDLQEKKIWDIINYIKSLSQ